ncbi:hypothetical protein TraAM80_08751 [Trypanosoma rangeli]|uniref:Uncharacterized protein n=1 Tax=Trypanosoma rangeli TaxID=5698 RepID=A0A422MZF9_TRYRA|nr:uncharacterized protein TraAM80_08751 [Trypanosoma rangeli]RNE98602.1 hypothetical protein TraAM80_08751 [Trypanosoma rangeli]|eukprot:RNE98602.1 hypothetical protein TraAM80_08751 [Trypanosoma rangeli]
MLVFYNNGGAVMRLHSPDMIHVKEEKIVFSMVTVLTRTLALSLVPVGEELCGFIELLIQADTYNQKTQCYLTIDTYFSLTRLMVAIVSDQNYYNVVYGASMIELILDVLELLMSLVCASPYQDVCKEE